MWSECVCVSVSGQTGHSKTIINPLLNTLLKNCPHSGHRPLPSCVSTGPCDHSGHLAWG
jgi:hypothetical protein